MEEKQSAWDRRSKQEGQETSQRQRNSDTTEIQNGKVNCSLHLRTTKSVSTADFWF